MTAISNVVQRHVDSPASLCPFCSQHLHQRRSCSLYIGSLASDDCSHQVRTASTPSSCIDARVPGLHSHSSTLPSSKPIANLGYAGVSGERYNCKDMISPGRQYLIKLRPTCSGCIRSLRVWSECTSWVRLCIEPCVNPLHGRQVVYVRLIVSYGALRTTNHFRVDSIWYGQKCFIILQRAKGKSTKVESIRV